MTRKQRRAEKHAAGRGKGRETAKRQPARFASRAQYEAFQARRLQARLSAGASRGIDELVALLKGANDDERNLIEKLHRDAGGVLLGQRQADRSER